MALVHFEGNVNSKAPKKAAPNKTRSKKNNRLKNALVDKAFKASAPKIKGET